MKFFGILAHAQINGLFTRPISGHDFALSHCICFYVSYFCIYKKALTDVKSDLRVNEPYDDDVTYCRTSFGLKSNNQLRLN